MVRVAPIAPAENDLLCERCGYTLNGLPGDANCPECGQPMEASLGQHRQPPSWESPARRYGFVGFIATSATVIFRPARFYRTITTRGGDIEAAKRFAYVHWLIASVLFAIAAATHVSILSANRFFKPGFFFLLVITFSVLKITTWAAAYLTAWEAAYRGYRLPRAVVHRGMYYHAAHYLPVAALAAITVLGYRWLLRIGWVDYTTATTYLYVLCGEVVVGAAYLFKTYWTAMRNMMFANR